MKETDLLWEYAEQLRCPVCFAAMRHTRDAMHAEHAMHALCCGKGHCFDIAAKGYVNFLSGQRKTRYSKELFESRRVVYDAGLYRDVAAAIADVAATQIRDNAPLVVVDAGCGEGYYSRTLRALHGSIMLYALDIEKEAIRIASRGKSGTYWMVADVANIPLADESVDFVLNAFTPANYAEFERILRPGGMLVKVVPREAHLQELRAYLGIAKGKGNETVAGLYESCFETRQRIPITTVHAVEPAVMPHIIRMSPLSFGRQHADVSKNSCKELTIDAELLIGYKRQ